MMNCDQASKGLRARRLEQVRRAGADALVTTCPKCITHLVCMQDEGGHESFRIMDLVELLAERLPAPAPQAAVGTVEAPSEGEGRAPARTAEPAVEGTVEGEPEDEGRKGRKGRRGGRRAGRKGKGRKGEAASRDDAAEGGVRP
jgi:hypothetical protein